MAVNNPFIHLWNVYIQIYIYIYASIISFIPSQNWKIAILCFCLTESLWKDVPESYYANAG